MPKLQKLPRETIFEKTGFMEITEIRSTEHGVKLCPQAKFSEKQVHGQTFYIVIININGFESKDCYQKILFTQPRM